MHPKVKEFINGVHKDPAWISRCTTYIFLFVKTFPVREHNSWTVQHFVLKEIFESARIERFLKGSSKVFSIAILVTFPLYLFYHSEPIAIVYWGLPSAAARDYIACPSLLNWVVPVLFWAANSSFAVRLVTAIAAVPTHKQELQRTTLHF